MKGLWIWKIFVLTCLAQPLFGECLPLTFKALEQKLAADFAKQEIEVIFFASWCVSCKQSFLESNPGKRIFIASFDHASDADLVIKRFKIHDPCYMDDGITTALKVKSLPNRMRWKDGRFLSQLETKKNQ